MGQGPMTGRGMGNCADAGRLSLSGRFCRWCPFANRRGSLSKDDQRKILLEEKEAIEQRLADLDS